MNAENFYDGECAAVVEQLTFFLDRELDSDDVARIQEHLEDCPPCDQVRHLEQLVKTLVARSCVEHAPAHLREQVLIRIRQVEIHLND